MAVPWKRKAIEVTAHAMTCASLLALAQPRPGADSSATAGTVGHRRARRLHLRLYTWLLRPRSDPLTESDHRHRSGYRLGYALFAGVGRVADDFSSLSDTDDLSAAGVGVRYRVSRKFPVDFSVDVAVNTDEESTTYIYVGQRF
jgi:hypothetical protein